MAGHIKVKWSSPCSFFKTLTRFRQQEKCCDATLVCEGKMYLVHKLVLSICSDYFEHMFRTTPCQHPVVVLAGIQQQEVEALLECIYGGSVEVEPEQIHGLLQTAATLQIHIMAYHDFDEERLSHEPTNVTPYRSIRNDSKPPHKIRKLEKANEYMQERAQCLVIRPNIQEHQEKKETAQATERLLVRSTPGVRRCVIQTAASPQFKQLIDSDDPTIKVEDPGYEDSLCDLGYHQKLVAGKDFVEIKNSSSPQATSIPCSVPTHTLPPPPSVNSHPTYLRGSWKEKEDTVCTFSHGMTDPASDDVAHHRHHAQETPNPKSSRMLEQVPVSEITSSQIHHSSNPSISPVPSENRQNASCSPPGSTASHSEVLRNSHQGSLIYSGSDPLPEDLRGRKRKEEEMMAPRPIKKMPPLEKIRDSSPPPAPDIPHLLGELLSSKQPHQYDGHSKDKQISITPPRTLKSHLLVQPVPSHRPPLFHSNPVGPTSRPVLPPCTTSASLQPQPPPPPPPPPPSQTSQHSVFTTYYTPTIVPNTQGEGFSVHLQRRESPPMDRDRDRDTNSNTDHCNDPSAISINTDPLLEKIPTSRKKRVRGPKSWEFLLRLLEDPECNPWLIRWENKEAGIFRLIQPESIAQRWGRRTCKNSGDNLSYENFARGLRYHYGTGAMSPVSERNFVYKFGPKALKVVNCKGNSEQNAVTDIIT